MIKLLQKGTYRIVGTKDHKIMLYLDEQGYLWTYAPRIGELLTFSKHPHMQNYILNQGEYRLYDVNKEPELVDLQHLELSVNSGWQGYLILTRLPTTRKLRSRIEATDEVISQKESKTL